MDLASKGRRNWPGNSDKEYKDDLRREHGGKGVKAARVMQLRQFKLSFNLRDEGMKGVQKEAQARLQTTKTIPRIQGLLPGIRDSMQGLSEGEI